uniref:Asparagine--tRNA ligase n=1 Tax=Candidatus Aschnera chinzeii TaxID=1485666 RepID=A0AAT9G509_9ENTR|nr:MAG: asparagine--tRNA ligase [Candidatus Aschnera chinzeii]
MKITSVVNILQGKIKIGKTIFVSGWVKTKRISKLGFLFVDMYDGSCFDVLQVIMTDDLNNYTNELLVLTTGCSLNITGILKESIGKKQKIELLATKCEVLGKIKDPHNYPISAKYHTVEYLREVAHLRPRTNIIGTIARIRNTLAQAVHYFFNKEGFIWISTPIITTLDTEGNGKMFRVTTLDMNNFTLEKDKNTIFKKDFFGCEAFLTVSGQLHGEAYACALNKIYTFGPTFRAENSNTSKHLSEFWMIEPEIAFADLNDIIVIAEKLLKFVVKQVLKKCNDDLTFIAKQIDNNIFIKLEKIISNKFIIIDYSDAIFILQKVSKKFKNSISWGVDLFSEHERYLVDTYFKLPVIIKNHPKKIKAFYMRINDDNKTVASMDILFDGIGEIIGGSQREERLNVLTERMSELQINHTNYDWYLDLRRYGSVPHAGFGIGFERLLSYITGTHNIRECIPFPRTPFNAKY